MQIPVMAADGIICRLIVSPAVAVKPHSQPNATTLPPPSEAAKIFLNVSEGERWGHRFKPPAVTISTHSTTISSALLEKPDARESAMPAKKSEAEQARSQHADLAKHYRAIGPAAILAALICAPKKRNAKAAQTAKAA